MIKELYVHLFRQGYAADLADEIHDAYTLDGGIEGVRELARAKTGEERDCGDFEHDYEDEFVRDVKSWQIEAGEI